MECRCKFFSFFVDIVCNQNVRKKRSIFWNERSFNNLIHFFENISKLFHSPTKKKIKIKIKIKKIKKNRINKNVKKTNKLTSYFCLYSVIHFCKKCFFCLENRIQLNLFDYKAYFSKKKIIFLFIFRNYFFFLPNSKRF